MTAATRVNFEKLFGTLPDQYVIIGANAPDFTVLGASDRYYKVAQTTPKKIIGKDLFDIFPDTSELAIKTGKGALQRSIEKCIKTKKPDSMGIIRYDIPRSDGGMVVRYWKAEHFPIIEEKDVIAVLPPEYRRHVVVVRRMTVTATTCTKPPLRATAPARHPSTPSPPPTASPPRSSRRTPAPASRPSPRAHPP